MSCLRPTSLLVSIILSFVALIDCHAPGAAAYAEERSAYPVTGYGVAGMESFEREFSRLLQSQSVPGAALAIARGGRLIYARGFGWADLQAGQPVKPDSLFRIASISKSLTAVAALKLCQDGKLKLDQKAFELLGDLKPCLLPGAAQQGRLSPASNPATTIDPRLFKITVRQLLDMTAGWSRVRSGDPVLDNIPALAARYCSPTLRPDLVSIIRMQMARRLDFDPGTDYAYGNFSYLVLGKIIERVSRKPYGQYVREVVLQPMGIARTRLGSTRLRLPDEVKYYGYPGEGVGPSLFPNVSGRVSEEYGAGFSLEASAPSIGWVSSTVDLLRFVSVLSGDRKPSSPLSAQMFSAMLTLPLPRTYYLHGEFPGEFFAMGWEVDPENTARRFTLSRHGSLFGTMSYVIRRSDGFAWAVLFNSRPNSFLGLRKVANEMIAQALKHQNSWPERDLFDQY